ncbi:MAG: aldo/keto reductase [Chloroflexi bacterium]|nr:aldo/keto reductase [Chloroflexota bacterium]
MQKRELGKTGEYLSIVGMGGIVVTQAPQEDANRFVAEAIDRGINYFDVAPSYGDAEERLGPALQPYRDRAFLACKTGKRDAAGAKEELERSLQRLQTDHFDLYQMHAMTSMEDVEKAFSPDGAMETFVQARKEGKVRFLGFSAHSQEAALECMSRFAFDSILFPFNFVTFEKEGFGPTVLEEAERRGVGRLALKGMAKTPWAEGAEHTYSKCWYEPVSDPEKASLALRFTLSLPITAAIPPGHVELFRLAMDIADRFTPITTEEREQVRQMAADLQPIFKKAA